MKIIYACSVIFWILMFVFDILYMKTGIMWCTYARRVTFALATIGSGIYYIASLKKALKEEDESEEH